MTEIGTGNVVHVRYAASVLEILLVSGNTFVVCAAGQAAGPGNGRSRARPPSRVEYRFGRTLTRPRARRVST